MDLPNRERALPQGSPRRSPKATRPGAAATEADENASPKRLDPAGPASPQRKKVLGERNDGGGGGGTDATAAASPRTPPQRKPKAAPGSPALTGRGDGPYDPKSNYTTPRPAFLRYDPERRREILLRVARAAEVVDDDCSSAASGAAASEEDAGSAASPVSSARRSDSEAELDESDDEGEDVAPARRGRCARRLFLLLVASAWWVCFISSLNTSTFLDHSEGVLEQSGAQIVRGDSAHLVHLYEQRAAPRDLRVVTMMGLTDVCLNGPSGELRCQIGDERTEDEAELRGDSNIDEHEVEMVLGSSQKDERSSEVGCLDGNISIDSFGSLSIHTVDMGESCSESVIQEEGEDCLDQSVPQLVSNEKGIELASDKLDDSKVLESEELNLDIELWQFFVPALFKYFQRSRKTTVPASQHMRSKSFAEVPVLVPQVAKLPVSHSPQAMELSVQLTAPKEDLSGSLVVHGEMPLPKSDPFLIPIVPVFGHENRDQILEKEGDPNIKASNGTFVDHGDADGSKPPVVELLGEFTFADSSRARSIRNMNQYALDSAAPQSLESLGKVVDKVQINSSLFQSPSAPRARKQESIIKGEKLDATPTPLRRSSRLRNKVTSP